MVSKAGEIGIPGLSWSGKILEEAQQELQWPDVSPIYQKMFRSNPEITLIKNVLYSWASRLNIQASLPEDIHSEKIEYSDDDKRARDFLAEVLDDVYMGVETWLTQCMTKTPLFGFGFWETPLCKRNENWRPPDKHPWRSKYNDDLIGIRSFEERRHTAFNGWERDTKTQRVTHYIQYQPLEQDGEKLIEIERGVHVVFGDKGSPEGVALLESAWRLSKIKYALEIVQGIGFERSAGYLNVETEESEVDLEKIEKVARNLLSAQESSYAAWPKGVKGSIIDSRFSSAPDVLKAIRFYSMQILSLLMMQFAAIATLSDTGSYSAIKDLSEFAIAMFNAMAEDFTRQCDEQVIERLFNHPLIVAEFPNITRRPSMTVNAVPKSVALDVLGNFITSFNSVFSLTDNDELILRERSEILPVEVIDKEEKQKKEEQLVEPTPESESEGDENIDDEEQAGTEETGEMDEDENLSEMAYRRPVQVSPAEHAIDVLTEAFITEQDIEDAIDSIPTKSKLLAFINADLKPEDDELLG